MSESYGIDSNVFQKKFKTRGEYVTSVGVDQLINNKFPSLSGTVQKIEVGRGLSILSGTCITKQGVIGLSARVSDLIDVSNIPAVNNYVLAWENNEWVPKNPQVLTGGVSPNILSITDLNNVGGINTSRNNITTTTIGSSQVNFLENTYISKDNYLHGQGIAPFQIGQDSSSHYIMRIQTDLGSIPLTYDGSDAESILITDGNLDQKRVPINRIDLSSFGNSGTSPFINQISFTGSNSPFSFITQGPNATIGVCLSNFAAINLSNTGPSPGVFGVLRIVNGGTSASTSEGARSNLGLSWNTDVMRCTGPIFSDWMTGENISLSGGTSTYINFNSPFKGENAPGIRYFGTCVQVSHDGVSWSKINGMSIGELENVNITTPSPGDVLIYTGTSFSNTGLYGDVTVDVNGRVTLTGKIPSTIIQTDTTSVTQTEFSSLTGVSEKIQTQLDRKLQWNTTPNRGDLVYYNNPTPGVCAVDILPLGSTDQVLRVGSTANEPSWSFIGNIFGTSTAFDTVGVFSSGTSEGYQINKQNFIDQITGTSGITSNIGPDLRINLSGIGPSQAIATPQLDDYNIYIEEKNTTDQNVITLENLSKSIIKTNAGLCYTNNLGIGIKLKEWGQPTDVASAGYAPERLELAYFNNYSGTSYIGVYSGTPGEWFGTSLVPLF